MPRQPRQPAASGIYHIVWRGVNKQQIFEDDYDCIRFLYFLDSCICDGFRVLAFALMGNHLHLLVQTAPADCALLECVMKSLGIRYVNHYNRRYKRVGSLFQGRFLSQPVEDSGYFLRVLRYIHNNPVAAGICDAPGDYQWTSFQDYFSSRKPFCRIDTGYAKKLNPQETLRRWHREAEVEPDVFMEDGATVPRLTDYDARKMIREISGCGTVPDFCALPTPQRDDAIIRLCALGIGKYQLSRLTGVSRGVILRVCHSNSPN